MVVYKYKLDEIIKTIQLPADATVVHVGFQNDLVHMWVEMDKFKPHIDRSFLVVPTGKSYDHRNLKYLGTAAGDVYVWHVFEELKD